MKVNCQKNNCKDVKVIEMNWLMYYKFEAETYDVIIGSDVVYFGCPVK